MDHPDYAHLIKNREQISGATAPHGRGSLGIMASKSPANPGTSEAVEIYLTDSNTLAALQSTLQLTNRPAVINVSHGGLRLSEDEKNNAAIRDFLKTACEKNILVSIAAGNGGELNLPMEPALQDCYIVSTSMNSALVKSDRVTSSPLISVGTSSDQYQRSVDMYHGWTSGAAPTISSALILAKKIMPTITSSQVKRILENTAGQLPGTSYHNQQTGHGIFNGVKFIKVLKMLSAGQLSTSDLNDREKIHEKLIAQLHKDEKLIASKPQMEKLLGQISSCQDAKTVFQKLQLTLQLWGQEHPDYAYLREQLQSLYRVSGNLHQAILLDPRNENGKIQISNANFKALAQINPTNLELEQQLKLMDLVGSLLINDSQKGQLAAQYPGIFATSEQLLGATPTIPLGTSHLATVRSLLKKVLNTFGDDFVQTHLGKFEKLRPIYDSLKKFRQEP